MNNENKINLSVDSDGNVLKCAKGASAGECGYVPGSKVCAKCGAMPVEVKMVPVDQGYDDIFEDEEQISEKAMPVPEVDMEDADESDEESEDSMTEEKTNFYEKYGYEEYMKKYGKKPWVMNAEDDESEMEEEMMAKQAGKKQMMSKPEMTEDDEDSEMEDEDSEDVDTEEEAIDMDEDDEDQEKMMQRHNSARKRRIESMGMKSEDFDNGAYLCWAEKKTHPADSPVCDNCKGGCVQEKGMPDILTVEGLAEKMFNGTVVESGYSQKADMFVVDVELKSGKVNEVYFEGSTGEVLGFTRLDLESFDSKSAFEDVIVIDYVEAAEIAVKSIDGEVISVEPDIFEGIDSYAVEIDGFDGKSYDVFISLDGEVLGYDKYEEDETEDIEAEAAEIALKRAFSDERRMQLAEEGMALPDGSYPIVSEEDLRNAIQAFGRAKDKEAAKLHIMKRAKDMGKEDLIPANWTGGTETDKKGIDEEIMASLAEFEKLQAEIESN
jgi:hypothetical protein